MPIRRKRTFSAAEEEDCSGAKDEMGKGEGGEEICLEASLSSPEGIESSIKRSFNDMQTADDIKKR